MNEKEYLAKFSHAVRWRLSASQAEEVISDYTEMLSQSTSAEEIKKKWGSPYEAARLLGDRKGYYIWLVVFALLMACLLVPILWILQPWIYSPFYALTYGVLFLGSMLCLYGFRPPFNSAALCPKKLIYAIIVLLFLQILVIGVISALWLYGAALPVGLPYGRIAASIIRLWGLAAAVVGVWAVFQARTKDYRWRALYILGLTGALTAVMIYGALTGLELSTSAEMVSRLIMDWCIYSVVGLIGAVLCLKKI